MEEQLVSLETAILAKEKGFNWPTLFYAFENNNAGLDYIEVTQLECQFGVIDKPEDHNNATYYELKRISLPTQALLQRWLREVHNIHICLELEQDWFYIVKLIEDNDTENFTKDWFLNPFKTYEQALEVGLIEGVKLIK